MSSVQATRSPVRPAGGSSTRSLLGKIGGGLMLAAIVTALTIALWPPSEAEKAREDGKQVGEAVTHVQNAVSQAEVDTALAELHDAVVDTRDHAGDAVYDQAVAQEDALDRAVDGAVGAATAGDDFEQGLYESELDVALDDLSGQADEFRTNAPEVEQAFWDGFDEGMTNN